MGDRAQVYIMDTGVYLYTHWGGSRIANDVREALAKRWRWYDPEYLARIIFDVMTRGLQGEEIGFGIGTSENSDLQHPLITINCDTETITIGTESQSFEEFIEEGE